MNEENIEKIVKFWDKIIEKKNKDKVNETIKKLYNKDMNELAQDYNKQSENVKKEVELLIDNRHIFEEKINTIQKNTKWKEISNVFYNKYWKEYSEIKNYADIVEDVDKILVSLIEKVNDEIFYIIYRAVILDIKYYKKEGKLIGNSSEERAKYFEQIIMNDDIYLKQFFNGYPEIFRTIDIIVENGIIVMKELLDNFRKEKNKICYEIFDGKNIGKISKIDMGKGDTHNGGRTVVVIEFTSGEKIVYKPRPLKIEKAYNDFITWIDRDENEKLLIPKVYYNDEVGWMEFVSYKSCNNKKDIEKYYYKVGKLMAILYMFNSNDMHSGNIIACGDSPVLIDLETLLHPLKMKIDKKSVFDNALYEFVNSVERSILLPSYIVNNNTKEKIDIGGLSGGEEQLSPFKSNSIENFESDDIKVVKKQFKMESEKNLPQINNQSVDVKQYLQYIESGFRSIYTIIKGNKEKFVEYIKNNFAKLPIRTLLRSTNDYSRKLNLSYHPDLMVNKIDRIIYLIRALIDNEDTDIEDLECEINQMLDTDIPYFYSYTDSRDLYYNNNLIKKDYFDASAIDILEEKVDKLSYVDMNRQISMMYSKFDMEYPYKYSKAIQVKECEKDIDVEKIISKFIEIIDNKSIRSTYESGFTWFNKKLDRFNTTVTSNMDISYYDGLLGMLEVLYAFASDNYIKDVDETVNNIENVLEKYNKENIREEKPKFVGDIISLVMYNKTKNEFMEYYNKYEFVLDKFIDIVIEDESIENLRKTTGQLLYIYEKVGKNDAFPIQRLKKIIEKLIDKIIFILDGFDCKMLDYYNFNNGVYGLLYILGRYKKIIANERYDIDNIIGDLLKKERENNILSKLCDFDKYKNNYVEVTYGKVLLKSIGFSDSKLNEEIDLAIDKLRNYIIGKNHALIGGDAGTLVMLYDMMNIEDCNKIRKLYNDYKYTFIKQFIDKELRKGGYFDVYENFSLRQGIAGVTYALMYTSDKYNMHNIFTF